MPKSDLIIVAGPCSVDNDNIDEIDELSNIEVVNKEGETQKAIGGTRIVGLKSRTALSPTGDGMGIDFPIVMKNLEILINGGSIKDFEVPPSAKMAEEVHKKTGMLVSTEIMLPSVQCPGYEGKFAAGKFMAWNPAVNQLGWQLAEIAHYARRNNWLIGIKNAKWIGDYLAKADSDDYDKESPLDKTWAGLVEYIGKIDEDIALIHRGVDIPQKGDYRNKTVHTISKRVKIKTGKKLFFDPSHIHGPKKRDEIVEKTIEAMKMKINGGNYLYDGVLIEAGNSKTDTFQHISLDELRGLVEELSEFRNLVSPSK